MKNNTAERMQVLTTRLAQYPLQLATEKDVTVSYRENGVQSDKTIVFLHGIGSSSASWLQQLESKFGGYRLIAWDAPGYGDSNIIVDSTSASQAYAKRLLILINHLQLEKIQLVGHSLGAIIAAAFAKNWPEKIQSLTFVNPALGYGKQSKTTRDGIVNDRVVDMTQTGVDGMAHLSPSRLLSGNAKQGAVDLVQWNTRRLRERGYIAAAAMLASSDLIDDIQNYTGPVLVLYGADDIVVPVESAKLVAHTCHSGIFQEIPNAGHAVYIEQADIFERFLLCFIRNKIEQ
jgi:pimeloyl-ACP methyl ester carboxylesterase